MQSLISNLRRKLVGNKAKGLISKRVFQKNKARQIFHKKTISYPLIRIRTCAYQGVRNVFFSGEFGVLCFLETPVLRFALLPYYRWTVLFEYFWAEFFRNYFNKWNEQFRHCQKHFKFRIKNGLFGYFQTITLKTLVIFNALNTLEIFKCKVLFKNKNLYTMSKIVLLGYFWAVILKKLFSYLATAPSNFF